jgi:hypothetical protein
LAVSSSYTSYSSDVDRQAALCPFQPLIWEHAGG